MHGSSIARRILTSLKRERRGIYEDLRSRFRLVRIRRATPGSPQWRMLRRWRGDRPGDGGWRPRMRRPRFSIAETMGTVALLAVGLAALRSHSDFWVAVVHATAFGMMGASILGLAYRQGGRRAFWL